jgi:hypothetical protein
MEGTSPRVRVMTLSPVVLIDATLPSLAETIDVRNTLATQAEIRMSES